MKTEQLQHIGIKYLSKLIDIPSDDNRNYCGIAIIDVSEIWTVNADIVYTPTYINNINIRNRSW